MIKNEILSEKNWKYRILQWESSCISARNWPISIPRPDLESILNSIIRFMTQKYNLGHYSGLRSRPKVKNLQLGSNVRFVKIKYRGPYVHTWFYGKLLVSFNGTMWKIQDFQFFSLFLAWNRQKFNDGRPCLGFLGRANFFSEKVSYVIAFS